MLTGVSRSRIASAALLCAAIVLCAETARANDLGGLAFVVFIWPIGIICVIVLAVLCIITARNNRKGPAGFSMKLSLALLVMACVIAVLFPAVTIGIIEAYRVNAPWNIAIISIAPVEVTALPVVIMNLAALRKRKRAGV